MKKLALTLALSLMIGSSAVAVPNLQLFSPNATYDAMTDTWITGGEDFEIWVIAANLNQRDYFDVTLVAALATGVDPSAGVLSITPQGGATTNYMPSDFTFGTPPPTDPIPFHGIFPTNYVTQLVAASITDGTETVTDYVPGGDGGTNDFGTILKFDVHTTFQFVHFDGFAFMNDIDGRRIFAPFSHDVSAVPEPATLALFGLGLAGAGIRRKFLARKSRS